MLVSAFELKRTFILMLGISPRLVREIRAQRMSWTLWAPLVGVTVLCFASAWVTGRLDHPLGQTFWSFVAILHAYFLAWILYFGAVPPLGYPSRWLFRQTHRIGYWAVVCLYAMLTAFFVHSAF